MKKTNTILALLMAGVFCLTSLSVSSPAYAEGTTEAAAVEEPAKTQEEEDQPFEQSLKIKDLKVTAKADAGVLPNDAKLKVEPITKGDDYKDIEKKVKKDAEDDDRELSGFLAYDISFEIDGQETEPNGKVDVTMEWDKAALPDDVEKGAEVSVLHLTDDDEVVDLTQNDVKEKDKDKDNIAEVKTKTEDDREAVEKMEMTVEGFSVFTITWSTELGEASVRFANVKIHYVDENGLELTDPETVPTSNLGDGTEGAVNIVNLSDWAKASNWDVKDENGNTTSNKLSDYTYKEAKIGTLKGTTVTGLRAAKGDVNENSATYKLYYTSDGTVYTTDATKNTWTQYKDATSGTTSNNADVYLIYKKEKTYTYPVKVHYMATAETGTSSTPVAIKDANGNELTDTIDGASYAGSSSDARTANGSHDFYYQYIRNNVPNGYTYNVSYINNNGRNAYRIYYGNSMSNFFRFLNYYKNDSKVDTLYWARGNTNWAAFDSTPEFYINFSPASSMNVTIHYVDTDGTEITTDTTSSVSNGGSLSSSTVGKDISGYTFLNAYYGYTNSTNTGASFTSLGYSIDNNLWTTKNGNTTLAGPVSEVWAVYTAKESTDVTVHHVDSSGKELRNTTTVAKADGSTLTPSDSGLAQTIAGYSADGTGYFMNGETKTTFVSISYSYNSDTKTWTTKYKETADGEEQTIDTPITAVYLNYSKDTQTMVFHHVDSTGTKLHEDTSLTISDDDRDNEEKGKGYGNQWNGFGSIGTRNYSTNPSGDPFKLSGLGDWQKMIVGDRTTETSAVITASNNWGLFYKYDKTAETWQTGVGSTMSSPNVTKDGFVTDIYNVYANKGIIVHHVDSTGKTIHDDTYSNVASGSTVTVSDLAIDTYALKGGHLKSYNGDSVYSLTYTKDSSENWSTTYKENSYDTAKNTGSPINEVWLVYDTDAVSKTITGHYVYQNEDGDYVSTKTADKGFTITNPGLSTSDLNFSGYDMGKGANPQYAMKGDGINTSGNDDFFGSEVKSSDGNTTLTYVTTRVGSNDGPEIQWIKLGEDGQLYYMTGSSLTDDGNAGTTLQLTRQGGRNIWTYATDARTYTLTRDTTGNYALSDSLAGRLDLNLTQTDENGVGTYTATYKGDGRVTQYSVKQSTVGSNANTNYTLTVEEWIPSDSTDIYFIYEDGSNQLSIDNDLIYSGRLKAKRSESLITDMANSTDRVYTWYKITTTDTAKTASTLTDEELANGTEVVRTQNGNDWNLPYEPGSRTWLDVAADDGARTTTEKVFYRLKVDYTNASGATKTVWSDPVEIEYYGQLENGSFETPYILNENGQQIADFSGNQTSNERYKANGGIWQTTARTTNKTLIGYTKDIEIFNVKQGNTGLANYWRNGKLSTNTNAKDKPEAKKGDQFAELNADGAGALYQDVITHPRGELSYWLSHRARISNNNKTQSQDFYDSMYLVIMPTSLAMTSGTDGGELDEQSELEKFIDDHGGFDDTKATAVEDRITYQDYNTGVLIRRISSDNYAWHTIEEYNGYYATSTMTRFFFVAAQTSNTNNSNDKTEGNFLDDVGFSQSLPTPEGFHLTITKTFSGLTSTQIASLASNASDVEGHDLSVEDETPFRITLSDNHVNTGENTEDADDSSNNNSALNGAVLEFRADGSGGSYSFTPTATKDGQDILTGRSEGTSHTNADGSVTMTWTFYDQKLDDTAQTYNYKAVETGESVDGFAVTTGKTLSNPSYINSDAVEIREHSDESIEFTNSYRRQSDSDQPEITVKKTFSGVTPETVAKLWSDGYTITVATTGHTTTSGADDNETATLSKYSDRTSGTLVSEVENADGSMTYTWVISGEKWGTGTYTVTESKFRTSANTLSGITIGGQNATPAGNEDTTTKDVTISDTGDTSAASLVFASGDRQSTQDSITAETNYTLPDKTNIIIGQYAVGDDPSTGTKHYIVWTPQALGRKTSNAIINMIKDQNGYFKDSNASFSTVSFRSGENPGRLTSNGISFTYNSNSHSLSFTNIEKVTNDSGAVTTEAKTWQKFMSTRYWVGTDDKKDSGVYEDQDIQVDNVYNASVKGKKISSESTEDNTILLSGAAFRLSQVKTSTSGEGDQKTTTTTTTYYKYTPASTSGGTPTAAAVSWENSSDNSTLLYTGPDGAFYTTPVYWSGTYDSSTTTLYNKSVASGDNGKIYVAGSDGKATSTEVTNSDKAVEAPLSKLDPATYYLEEVTAPDGYNRLTKKISFLVNKNGTISLEMMEEKKNGQTVTDSDGNAVMVPLKNDTVDNNVASVDWRSPYYTITIKNEPGTILPETGGMGTWPFIFTGLALVAFAGFMLWKRKRSLSKATYNRLMDEIHKR